jgi:hypothetical protein
MNKDKVLLVLVLVLAASTVAALIVISRMHSARQQLQAQLTAQTRALAQARLDMAPPPPPPPALPARPAPVSVDRPETAAKLAALEAEVTELRRQAGERAARDVPVARPAETNRDDRGRGRRFREEDMAELQKTDPARFAEIEKQRAEFRDRIKTAAADQVNFLTSVDVSRWSAEQQENHARLLANIAAFTDAMTQRNQPAATDGRSMWDKIRETGELMETEQNLLLYDAAQQMGFDEKGSKEFVDYIQTIQKATSPRGFFPGFGHGGRGGGNGGGDNTPAQEQPQPRQ